MHNVNYINKYSIPGSNNGIGNLHPEKISNIDNAVNKNNIALVNYLRNMNADQFSFALVSLLHISVLFFILFGTSKPQVQPLLSFTVTLMDFSSSPNVVANATSSPNSNSKPVTENEIKMDEAKTEQENIEASFSELSQRKKETKKAAAKKQVQDNAPKTNAPVSVSSQQQTAVISTNTPAKFDAAYLKNEAPTYPPLSRKLGEKGNILLNVFVSIDGRAEKIEVNKSSGFSRLDSAALNTVRNWRFISAKRGGQLIASWVQVPVSFVLE